MVVLMLQLLIFAALGYGIYWIVRAGVRAGTRDAGRRRG